MVRARRLGGTGTSPRRRRAVGAPAPGRAPRRPPALNPSDRDRRTLPSDTAATPATAASQGGGSGTTAGGGPSAAGPAASGGLARRYAQALLDLASERGATDAAARGMEAVAQLARTDNAFRALVNDPRLDSVAQRAGALAVLERAGAPEEVRNLVGVLVDNRRLSALPQVATAFAALLAERRGQQTAEVATAHPLTDVQRAALVSRLTEAGYPNARLVERVDPALLGGLVLRVGSRLYDTSIKTRLQRLSHAMKGAA